MKFSLRTKFNNINVMQITTIQYVFRDIFKFDIQMDIDVAYRQRLFCKRIRKATAPSPIMSDSSLNTQNTIVSLRAQFNNINKMKTTTNQ